MARKATWRCTRTTGGVQCRHENSRRLKRCTACGKPRPVVKRAEHLSALDLSYEEYIEFNGGERCGNCGALPTSGRRLDRDHDHTTGLPRGLLCPRCNRQTDRATRYIKVEDRLPWLRRLVAYLERAEEFWRDRA